MFGLIIFMLMSTGDPGPGEEGCAFTPADDPCHFEEEPPVICHDPGGWVVVCQ